MALPLATVAGNWDLANHRSLSGEEFNEIHQRLVFLERTHFREYVPTSGPEHPDFEGRLGHWLDNLPSESDQRLLFEFAPTLTFLTRDDFTKLHQSALKGPISRWIADELALALDDPDFNKKLWDEICDHTWFCPLTDSMPIGDFYHANNIGGIDFRPDWQSITKFAEVARLVDFMERRRAMGIVKPLKRLVLLEDFVGSGGLALRPLRAEQLGGAAPSVNMLEFASRLGVPVLVVPLIVCPAGLQNLRAEIAAVANVSLSAVLELAEEEFIAPGSALDPNSIELGIRNLVQRVHPQVDDGQQDPLPYTAYGFAETGARIVLYSNSPANTLPVVQHQSTTWNALFPRSARIQ